MANHRLRIPMLLATALVLCGASAGWAQDASADQAKALLERGVEQYEALQFRQAKATLLDAAENRQALGETGRKTLDDYLARVDTAIKRQAADQAAMATAREALAANDLDGARKGFAQAAGSEYLPAGVREEATEQLALVDERMEAARAAEADAADPAETEADDAGGTDIAPTPTPAQDETDDGDIETIVVADDETDAGGAEPAADTDVMIVQPEDDADVMVVEPAGGGDDEDVVIVDLDDEQDAAARTEAPEDRMLAAAAERRAKAQELIAKGKSALDNDQPEQAVDYFERALALEPDSEEASRLLEASRQLTASSGESGLIDRIAQRRRVARQIAVQEYEQAMRRAREQESDADSEGDFAAAQASAREAQNVLETNKRLFTADRYREMLAEARNLRDYIADQREQWERRRAIAQQQEIAEAESERRAKEREQRERKIETLVSQARTLRDQRSFGQALEVYEQINRLAPENREAAEAITWLNEMVILMDEKEAYKIRQREEQKVLADIRWSEIPWYELLKYPRDWREITVKREPFGAGAASESEADRLVRQKLRSQIISPKFQEVEFTDVIGFLRDVTGVNFYVNWTALTIAGIDKTTPVTVELTDVPAETTLRKVLDSVGGVTPLSYAIEDGVVTISTRDDLSQRTVTRVYDIRDLIIRVPDFSGPRIELDTTGDDDDDDDDDGGGLGGGGLFGDDDDDDDDDDEGASKTEIIADIIDTIEETIDPTSWRPAGEIGAIREMHGQLIVTQTPENHSKLLDLLGQLREARALQIAIEARFISVNSGFLNSIGIDLDFFFNLGSTLGSGDNRTISDPWTGTTTDVNRGGRGSWSDNVTPVNLTQNTFPFANMVGTSTSVPNSIGGLLTAPSMSMGGTFLNDIQVDFLIEATQAHQSTRALTAPRLTLYNGQRAYITVATQQAYVSDLEPVVSENTTSFAPTLSYVPTGAVLDVEATISADRRYVTLTVRPQVAVLNGFTRYFTNVASVDAEGEPLTGTGFIQLPNVTIQDLQTTVSVPDGGTLLLGGQKLSGEVEREMGVPVLSKIPVINRVVTNRGMVRDEQTLLILIKPKIIIQREAEEEQFP